MARIVILTHACDDFPARDYLLGRLVGPWAGAGHAVWWAAGPGAGPEADVAILHVDLSVVPPEYVAAARRYPAVVNGAALDIRKKVVSRHLVRPGDGWDGPVIVKTDLNSGAQPELRLRRLAQGGAGPVADTLGEINYLDQPYPILRSAREVPDEVWAAPGLVVERFLPEQDARGFWMRAWVFLGDRERCTRYLGSHPIVKAGDILAREPAPVPDELRAERRRLGFDYGKFDFVVRDGRAVLFDANRTPWAPPPSVRAELEASDADLARGLDQWLRA